MQVGFTRAEVRDAFKVISADAYGRVGFEERVPLRINQLDKTYSDVTSYAYAATKFCKDEVFDWSIARPSAELIAFDSRAIPLLHEDELEECIRHECAHHVAGIRQYHSPKWAHTARAMGCKIADREAVLIRNSDAWFDAIKATNVDRDFLNSFPSWDELAARAT